MLASLIKYYDNSLAIINNNTTTSAIFSTMLGVKQGGPLSPLLFAIYLEDLVDNIEAAGMGIQAGGNAHKVNILLYADDIILVSQSTGELQAMLNMTSQYGIDHEIKFNPTKTNGIVFGGKAPPWSHALFTAHTHITHRRKKDSNNCSSQLLEKDRHILASSLSHTQSLPVQNIRSTSTLLRPHGTVTKQRRNERYTNIRINSHQAHHWHQQVLT